MKTLYIDCSMGAAGDMLTSALLELLSDPNRFIEKLNNVGIPKVVFSKTRKSTCRIQGSHMEVLVNGKEEGDTKEHMHCHRSMKDIETIIDNLQVSQGVKENAKAVYQVIAEAESNVHGVPVTDLHFHEVGTMDAIADITAVCMLMEEIDAKQVVVSPIHVGCGSVKCAHGILPVPAPATAWILQDCPIYGGEIEGELCTPTGAALLKHFATSFGDMPMMTVSKTGYGVGKKEFEKANCVRAMLGETRYATDTIIELDCNIDDMTAEEIGFVMERLFEGGALEVFTIPIGMKKNRPGHLLHVLCEKEDKEKMLSLLFRDTTTLGVRENFTHRYKLDRETEEVVTPYGVVRKKRASGYGVERYKYEYDDISRIAKQQNMTLAEVRKMADEAK